MTTAISPTFTATWEPITAHLIPPTTKKTAGFIASLFPFSFLLSLGHKLAKWSILPASRCPIDVIEGQAAMFDSYYPIPKRFNKSSHEITTPDGATLEATLFASTKADANTPTIIYFQPNGTIHRHVNAPHLWLLQIDRPFNLVAFDYRGIGGNFEGKDDFIIDGASILQWVRKELKTPDPLIHFYGYSLGGAFATYTQALDPKLTGRLVNERSFTTIIDVVKGLFTVFSALIIPLIKFYDFDINPLAEFEKIRGKKLVVFHPEDPIMYGAHLADRVLCDKLEMDQPYDQHICHLTHYQKQKIANFLFMDTLDQRRSSSDS